MGEATQPVAGGMLRVGVPEFRLPTWVIQREIQEIIDLGVELRLNTPVENLDDLFAQGFQAALIAVGAHEGRKLPIPGADHPDVLVNTRFLRDVRLGVYADGSQLGQNVLVLGGGNVAFDCARTAVRLGRPGLTGTIDHRWPAVRPRHWPAVRPRRNWAPPTSGATATRSGKVAATR